MQKGETGHLAAHLAKPVLQLPVLERPVLAEFLPSLGNRGLLGYYPGMQGATDIAQTAKSIERPHAAPRHPDQPHHLPLELLEAHQVQGIFQHAAEAAVVFGSGQDDPLSRADGLTQPEDIWRILNVVVLAGAKGQRVLPQIDQLGTGAQFASPLQRRCQGQAGLTGGSDTTAPPHHAQSIH